MIKISLEKRKGRNVLYVGVILTLIILIGLTFFYRFGYDEYVEQTFQGKYDGTYSFEGEVGLTGRAISFIDFDLSNRIGTSVMVVEQKNRHKEVLELIDATDYGGIQIRDDFFVKEDGTIEFWVLTNNSNIEANICILRYQYNILLVMTMFKGVLRLAGDIHLTFYKDLANIINNKWYHIRIDFSFEKQTFTILTNREPQVENHPFLEPANYIDSFGIETGYDSAHFSLYYDAIGYSWDENYNVGDNYR